MPEQPRGPLNPRQALDQELVQLTVGVEGAPVARNPKTVDAPAPSDPLYDRLRTVAVVPLVVRAPFQTWLIVCPLGSVQEAVQLVMAAGPAVTVTSPWNPPGQKPTVW